MTTPSIAGVDVKGEALYVTDPSGTFVPYSAVAIGAGADEVNDFLDKAYNADLTLEDAGALAVAAINLKAEKKDGVKHVKMAKITSANSSMEKVSDSDLEKYLQVAEQKFKQSS